MCESRVVLVAGEISREWASWNGVFEGQRILGVQEVQEA